MKRGRPYAVRRARKQQRRAEESEKEKIEATTRNLTQNTGRAGPRRIKRLRLKDTRLAYRARLEETEQRKKEEKQRESTGQGDEDGRHGAGR